ncbi:MAG: glutathione S-transferase family protein [Myxococcales bacterium]|nr:glutathione S-transferase family protein [Myxococcales bacterium]
MKPTLVSFKLCPFVQRSAIMLEEKGVEYDLEFIELSSKPAWFTEISPLGKVPLLRIGDEVLFESAVINEYLDETHGTRLLPEDPLRRARDRAFVEVANQVFAALADYTSARDAAGAEAAAEQVRQRLGRCETELSGPLWHGDRLTLVDAAMAPALQRLRWLAETTGQDVLAALPRVRAWGDALLGRGSVQRSTVPEIRTLYMGFVSRPRGVDGHRSYVGQRVLDASAA